MPAADASDGHDGPEGVKRDHVETEVRDCRVREGGCEKCPIAALLDIGDAEGEILMHLLDEIAALLGDGILPCAEDGGVQSDDGPNGRAGGTVGVEYTMHAAAVVCPT